ncbi:MAG: hypothetical protein V2J07_03160 [Anaerolineae bacterium]|nr:hypothetical protein [Anaerolineae bacterium]
MTDLLTLEVLSPGKVLLRVDNIKKIIALAEDGQIGIFPGHTLLLAETVDGPLRYETEAGEETISLSGGILKVSGSTVVIFSGGFYDEMADQPFPFDLEKIEAEQEFSRLTKELSRRLKLE